MNHKLLKTMTEQDIQDLKDDYFELTAKEFEAKHGIKSMNLRRRFGNKRPVKEPSPLTITKKPLDTTDPYLSYKTNIQKWKDECERLRRQERYWEQDGILDTHYYH